MLQGKLNTVLSTLLSLLVVPLLSGVATAAKQSRGPSTVYPRNALWITFEERLQSLRETAERLDGQVEAALRSMETTEDVGTATIEDAYGHNWEMRQAARTLAAFGEPAGHDFQLRHDAFKKALMEQAAKIAERPNVQREILRGEKTLASAFAKADRKMDAVRKLAEKQQYARAMETFFKIAGPLEKQALWWELKNGRRHPSLVAWDTMVKTWSAILFNQWRDEGKLACTNAVQALSLDLDGLISRMRAAATAIAESGKPGTEEGSPASGPDAIERFGQEWIKVQTSVLQARSYTAINRFLGETAEVAQIENAYDQFIADVGPAMAAIIQADARRAGPEEAGTLYFSYIEKLPEVLARCTGGEFLSLAGQALDDLASKSPSLTEDIAAYRACTDDLLRWRRRTSEAYLRTHLRDFPSLDSVITSATNSYGKIFLVDRRRPGLMAKIRTPVPATLATLEPDFVGKKTSVKDLLFTNRISHAVTRIQRRTVTFVRVDPAVLQPAAQHLAGDLFVEGAAPAPSLKAQMAAHAARTNDLLDVGGTIRTIGVMGWFTRFTSLAPDDRGIVRLAPLDREPDAVRTDDIVVMFVVLPEWIRSEYFFVALPQDG